MKIEFGKMSKKQNLTCCFYKVFIFLFAAVVFSSCQILRSDAGISAGRQTESAVARSFGQAFDLEAPEMNPQNQMLSLAWATTAIPKYEDGMVSEADLFMGYTLDSQSTAQVPKPGHCQWFEKRKNQDTRNVIFQDEKTDHVTPKKFFFILDAQTDLPVASARLDATGKASCLLPAKEMKISFGFGAQRHDIDMPVDQNEYHVPFARKALISIHPTSSGKSDVRPGDLIRIGRSYADEESTFFEKNASIGHAFPIELKNDLYKKANIQSQNMGVDEYLQTSFLVNRNAYKIALDEGSYFIALMRKNKIICIQHVDLSKDMGWLFSCPQSTKDDDVSLDEYEANFSDVFLFDRVYANKPFFKDTAFKEWLFLNQEPIEKYYFDVNAFVSSEIKDEKLFLLDQGSNRAPFSVFIRSNGLYASQKEWREKSNVTISNGVEMRLFDYSFADGQNFSSTAGQKFRLRLSIPAWNSTDVVEMLVNDNLYSRWVLNRGQLSRPYSINLEKTLQENKNFTVQFQAYGSKESPDFFNGDSVKPFAQTRVYCVKINPDSTCQSKIVGDGDNGTK